MAQPSHLVFSFLPLKGQAGFLTWKWEAQDKTGRVVLESKESFELLTKCIGHAASHGYVETARAA